MRPEQGHPPEVGQHGDNKGAARGQKEGKDKGVELKGIAAGVSRAGART